MNFATTFVWSKIAFVCLVLAFVLHIVGFATTAWFILELTMEIGSSTVNVTVDVGLWKLCAYVEAGYYCVDISTAPKWFQTVALLESLGLVLIFTSGITTIVKLCSKSTTCPNPKTIIFLFLVSGISIGIGVAVYKTQKEKFQDLLLQRLSRHQATGLRSSLGYSLILCAVASGICLCVCPPLFILDHGLNKHACSQSAISFDYQEMTPDPAVTCMDGQHLLPAQSHVTVQNTTLESSGQVYGKQLKHLNLDQVVAVHGKACVGDQYPTIDSDVYGNAKPKF